MLVAMTSLYRRYLVYCQTKRNLKSIWESSLLIHFLHILRFVAHFVCFFPFLLFRKQ